MYCNAESLVCTSKVIGNDLRRVEGRHGHFYGLGDSEDAKLSTSDEEVEDHGETASSTMMPEMRLTIESG